MIDIKNDIQSLTMFKRNTAESIKRLKASGHPLFLTVNGQAEVVVQDAEAYQKILDRLDAIEGIRRGLAEMTAGQGEPAVQVHSEMRKKYGIPS
ncbi:type II toxin-antitoxin system Phd/YefM family antitoxin [Candidatus Sumerlaeota bacterium]|nr:type II toxin-antitoxin system Phd/YefM family antitoxin [Candidatus Sumerlaeota bacterium]